MSGENQHGFTVIETTIFLAISAVLFVGVLAGTGTALARQRYTDSVRATESFLQQQVERTFSFANARDGSQACNAGVITTGTDQPAGTSRCYVLGKAVRFAQGSSTATIYNVIGTEPTTIITSGAYSNNDTETEVLELYQPRAVMGVAVETFDVPWDARFFGASQDQGGSTTPINTILFLRSPRSGGLMLYTTTVNWGGPAPGGTLALEPFIDADKLQKVARVCVQSQDFTGTTGVAEVQLTGQGGQGAIRANFDGINTAICRTIP